MSSKGDTSKNKVKGLYDKNKYSDIHHDDVHYDKRGSHSNQGHYSNYSINASNHKKHSNYSSHSNHSSHSNYHYFTSKKNYYSGITKEEWVLANYSFLIRPHSQVNNTNEGILRETVHDPDSLIDWNAIEIVRYKTEHIEQCPICLDEYKAPRATKCGHLYCLPCILRYLSDSEYNYKKCPMCNESIYARHLKPVQIESIGRVRVDFEEQFSLIKRKKDSIIIYGADKIIPPMCSIHVISGEPAAEFNRYMVTYDMDKHLTKDLESLRKYVENNELDDFESIFLEQAQNEIINKIIEWNTWTSENLPYGNPAEKDKEKHIQKYLNLQEEKKENLSSSKSDSNLSDNENGKQKSDEQSEQTKRWILSRQNNIQSKQDEEEEMYYFFYQLADGNTVYLDSLCTRILSIEYGGFKNLPVKLSGKITHVEKLKTDDFSRKKFVFTKHLPYNAEFTVVEIDVEPFVSPQVYSKFKNEIHKRIMSRRYQIEKEKKMEENAKKKAEEEEERMRKEMEKQRFIWRETDFPKVDQYGREIVPSISEFAPLESTSTTKPRNRKLKNTEWGNAFIPSEDSISTSAPTNQNRLENTEWGRVNDNNWTKNEEQFPQLSSGSKKRRRK